VPSGEGSVVLDPTVVTIGLGLLASVVAGKGLVRALERLPPRRRRVTEWLLIVGAALTAIVGNLLSDGPVAREAFAFLVAALPGTVAYLAWRTVYASALIGLVPGYFVIAAINDGRTMHVPAIALDRIVPLEPGWVIVYGSLLAFVLVPLLVVRDQRLFRRVLQAWVTVIVVAYVGFLVYPTVALRPTAVPADGFFAWCLALTYSLDTPYNCFPCLHVAHSFVSALASYRVHKGVGVAAVAWASLIGVSTLYTKQHYALDVIAGALIAYVAYVVFLRGYPRECIAEADRRRAPLRALGVIGVFGFMVVCFWVAYQTRTAGL
jgi:membrane-associated phospholipid phosphatase